jgi:phage gp29-like protein
MPASVRRIAKPSPYDQRPNASRFSALTPERVAAIQKAAERGDTRDWSDLCTRMLQADAHVRACMDTRTSAIAGSRWVVESGDPDDPEANRAAAFCDAMLRGMRGSKGGRMDVSACGFDRGVAALLEAIGIGFAATEIDWEWRGGVWTIPRLYQVQQRRFRWSDDWQLLLVDNGETISSQGDELPPHSFVVHTPHIHHYPTQGGCLWPVSWMYLFKRWCVQFWIAGSEQYAYPLLVGQVPRGAPASVRTEMLNSLNSLSASHAAVLEADSAIELVETSVKDNGTWRELVRELDRQISKAILGTTEIEEAGRNGSRAAVETRKGATVDARLALDERALAETVRRDLLTPIVRYNSHVFGGRAPAIPSIRWIVESKRREIPQSLIDVGAVTVNELRFSTDLEPLPGDAGERLVGAPAPTEGNE